MFRSLGSKGGDQFVAVPGERITVVEGKPKVIDSRSALIREGGPITVDLCDAARQDTALEVSRVTVDGFCNKAGADCPYRPEPKRLTD